MIAMAGASRLCPGRVQRATASGGRTGAVVRRYSTTETSTANPRPTRAIDLAVSIRRVAVLMLPNSTQPLTVIAGGESERRRVSRVP